MDLLVFVDLHGSKEALKVVLEKAKDVDLVVCAGDLSEWGQGTDAIIYKFEKEKIPMLVIPGNHEFDEELMEICRKCKYVVDIHRAHYEVGEYFFFGYGGGGFALESKEFERLSEAFIKQTKDRKDKKVILVTHGPPYGTKVDFIPGLGHRGCKSIRNFIEKHQPLLNICGHLHETVNAKDRIGKTIIINPGPEGKIIKI